MDAGRYTIRVTPRTPASTRSAVDVATMEKLLAVGRVGGAGTCVAGPRGGTIQATEEATLTPTPMRAALVLSVALALGACGHQRPTPSPAKELHVATAADSAFVRRVCYAPDSVLAGSKPCIQREQRNNIRVF